MLKRLWVVAILLTALNTNAQTDTTAPPKRYSHQVGVQVNELLRQIFNFNGTAVNTNPYLLTYSINSVKTGWGLRLGFGYDYQSLTIDDGITRKTTDLNDVHIRLGAEKAFSLSSKWSTGLGLDLVVDHNDDFTKSVVRSFDTVTTATTSQITSFGGGAMGWIRYNLTKSILIGTECSFYYKKGQEDTRVAITRREFGPGGGQITTKTTVVDNERIEGKLAVPVAIFLIVRF